MRYSLIEILLGAIVSFYHFGIEQGFFNESLVCNLGSSQTFSNSSELLANLGKPHEDFKNEKGNLILVYNTKKYGIPCERRFEINNDKVVVGFVSNGCF